MIKSPQSQHSYALLLYYYVFLFGEMIQYPKLLLSQAPGPSVDPRDEKGSGGTKNRPRNGSGAVCFDVLEMIGGDLNFGRHQFRDEKCVWLYHPQHIKPWMLLILIFCWVV